MFDIKSFVARCRTELGQPGTQQAIARIMESVVREPDEIDRALGPLGETKLQVVERSPELTILHVCFAPGTTFYPHNHGMWSIVSVYRGVEENEYFTRKGDTLELVRRHEIKAGEVAVNDPEVIHAVANRESSALGAIHVYGGDFFTSARSEWDPVRFIERPYDLEKALRNLNLTR